MAHPQNPATHPSNTPFDPAFHLDMLIMSATSALAALHRGDLTAASGCAAIAAEFATAAQQGLKVVR